VICKSLTSTADHIMRIELLEVQVISLVMLTGAGAEAPTPIMTSCEKSLSPKLLMAVVLNLYVLPERTPSDSLVVN